MSSDQHRRTGIKRTDKGGEGYPEQFTIVGLDIEADALKARYVGTKRHKHICDVINGAVQRQRASVPPTEGFIRLLRRAVQIPDLIVCDLGRDGTTDGFEINEKGKKVPAGLNHVLVIDGRKRNMSTRANNKTAEAAGLPPRQLGCTYVTFPAIGTREAVVMLKVGANVTERRTPSSLAEDADDMKRHGWSDEDIAPYVQQKDAAGVALLHALHKCEDCVKQAVDADKIALTKVKVLATLDPIVQVQRVARMVAPATKAGRDAAAAPRAKARPAAYMTALASALPERTYDVDDVRDLIAHLTGGAAPSWMKGAQS